MNRFIVILLTGVAVALGTAGTAQAHDRDCHRSSYRSYCPPRSYSYCPPTYRSYNYCPPTYYRSYSCAPRYYTPPCYSSRSYSISVPGFGFYYRR